MKSYVLYSLLAVLVILIGGYLIWLYFYSVPIAENAQGTESTIGQDKTSLAYLEWRSTHIFAGNIQDKVSEKQVNSQPEFQYRVQVIETTKGQLEKSVIVSSAVPLSPISGHFDNFYTKYNKQDGWYEILWTYKDNAGQAVIPSGLPAGMQF